MPPLPLPTVRRNPLERTGTVLGIKTDGAAGHVQPTPTTSRQDSCGSGTSRGTSEVSTPPRGTAAPPNHNRRYSVGEVVDATRGGGLLGGSGGNGGGAGGGMPTTRRHGSEKASWEEYDDYRMYVDTPTLFCARCHNMIQARGSVTSRRSSGGVAGDGGGEDGDGDMEEAVARVPGSKTKKKGEKKPKAAPKHSAARFQVRGVCQLLRRWALVATACHAGVCSKVDPGERWLKARR